jgi:hypothetical protein
MALVVVVSVGTRLRVKEKAMGIAKEQSKKARALAVMQMKKVWEMMNTTLVLEEVKPKATDKAQGAHAPNVDQDPTDKTR